MGNITIYPASKFQEVLQELLRAQNKSLALCGAVVEHPFLMHPRPSERTRRGRGEEGESRQEEVQSPEGQNGSMRKRLYARAHGRRGGHFVNRWVFVLSLPVTFGPWQGGDAHFRVTVQIALEPQFPGLAIIPFHLVPLMPTASWLGVCCLLEQLPALLLGPRGSPACMSALVW